MLSRLQELYAGHPVRFLLFPCNQFGEQEPGTNAEIKAFAQKYITLGSNSNIIMFAKSNLNNVTCTSQGSDACQPSSAECCPANDVVYDYLLSETSPGEINWNFDKIFVDSLGRPFSGETILHGGDLDKAVGRSITRASGDSTELQVVSAAIQMVTDNWSNTQTMSLFAGVVTAAIVMQIALSKRQPTATEATRPAYIMMV